MKETNILGIMIVLIILISAPAPGVFAKKGQNKGKAKGKIERISHNQGNKGLKKGYFRKSAAEKNQKEATIIMYVPTSERRNIRAYSRADNTGGLLYNLDGALNKLEHTRWYSGPNDTRGQGNMGKVDMIAPYGQDKDSNRMELYGNRGRVIKVIEPEPQPAPEPNPEPAPEPAPQPEPSPEPPPLPLGIYYSGLD